MSRVMDMSRSAGLTLAGQLAAFRSESFPVIPTLIILIVALLAIFANVVAPYDPEIGVLGERFRPPAWQVGRQFSVSARHRSPRP